MSKCTCKPNGPHDPANHQPAADAFAAQVSRPLTPPVDPSEPTVQDVMRQVSELGDLMLLGFEAMHERFDRIEKAMASAEVDILREAD